MWSLETINHLNREAARAARREHLEPWHPTSVDDIAGGKIHIPFVGDHTPKGWKRTEYQWFVDTSGFGRPGEPALTQDELVERLRDYYAVHPDHGYALVEQRQFQGYVEAFEPLAKVA